MADRNLRPDSGNDLVLEDAGSTDRLRITDGGSTILYEDGGAAALTIETDSDIKIDTGNLIIGTAGKGVDFSAQTPTSASGASTTAELFDHYEEGTWTISCTGSGVLSSSSGFYVRIGKVVLVSGYLEMNGSTSDNTFTGLPFVNNAGTSGRGSGGTGWNNIASSDQVGVLTNTNSSTFNFNKGASTQTVNSSAAAHFSFWYLTT